MNALLEKLKKNSSVKEAEILAKSKFFNDKDMVVTPIPALNVALSGRLKDNMDRKWAWNINGRYGYEADGPCVFVEY